ncbi:ATP-binding protein [Streptomyces sp. NPDC005141]
MTSAPPATEGVSKLGDDPHAEHQARQRQVQTYDVMSVCFEVSPGRTGQSIVARDARRVRMARTLTAARLRHCGLELMTDDVTLIVSELLTNALLHSGTTEISLTIALRDGFLRITVRDGMAGCAEPSNADQDAESGRGLALVDALVKENGGVWGTSDAGAVTWCRLTVPAEEKA